MGRLGVIILLSEMSVQEIISFAGSSLSIPRYKPIKNYGKEIRKNFRWAKWGKLS